MDQSILNIEAQRWVSAIVKLTSLTYQGKLRWQKQSFVPINEKAMATISNVEPPVRYTVSSEGKQFVLIVTPRDNAFTNFLQSQIGAEVPEAFVTFEVRELDGKKLFSVSRLSVLQGLADAVRSQVDRHEEEALSAIEKIAM